MSTGEVLTGASSLYMVLVALLIGSFVNLAADRLPRGESVVVPASFCRGCGRRLNVIDLVPVAGYVIRRGRCATCGVPIGVSAPLVEAAAGIGMAVPVVALGPIAGGLLGAMFVAVLATGVIAAAMRRSRPVRS